MTMSKEVRTHSRMAVWRAMGSEYAERLQEIALEHNRLANEMGLNRHMSSQEKSGFSEKIDTLRAERDEIIKQFEGEDGHV